MQTNNRLMIPSFKTKDDIYELFMKRVCKDDEVWIDGEPFLVNINYAITDPKAEGQTGKIIPEKEGLYTESPVLEINDVEAFKTALYDYVKAYNSTESRWTRPDISEDWESVALYAMTFVWTDATNQDFSNPISFLKRYTDFITTDQLSDLKEPKEAGNLCGAQIFKQVNESGSERETPNNYTLYILDEEGNKQYFPSVCYGIQDDKAYICAIHHIYGKINNENEKINKIRNHIKGRGVEPLGIATLISFIEECKKRGIKQIVMPDNFVLQYTSKNRLNEEGLGIFINRSLERTEEERERLEDKLNNDHKSSLDKRLMTMHIISRYYSTGIKVLEIPGDVSDNLTVDIQDFKLGREEKKQEDRRNRKPKLEEEMR